MLFPMSFFHNETLRIRDLSELTFTWLLVVPAFLSSLSRRQSSLRPDPHILSLGRVPS